MNDADQEFLKVCLTLVADAALKGNSAVGAVIVLKNTIIARAGEAGTSRNDVTCHAEIEAMREAVSVLHSNDLSPCVLYSTHEPCIMCSYVIRYHRIAKVVYINKVRYLAGISSPTPLLVSLDVPPHWSAPPKVEYVGGGSE